MKCLLQTGCKKDQQSKLKDKIPCKVDTFLKFVKENFKWFSMTSPQLSQLKYSNQTQTDEVFTMHIIVYKSTVIKSLVNKQCIVCV